MTGFARQHDYRLGRALLVSTVLVLAGAWLVPLDWLEIFGRDLRLDPRPEAGPDERWVRLVEVQPVDPGALQLREIQLGPPKDGQSPDTDMGPEARRTWTFDPTTAYRPLPGAGEPLAPSPADSVVLHRTFLHAMRLGNMGAVFAMLDTTQTGRAREQLIETDDWVNRYLGPVWRAEGHARFQSDLWWRVVGEVEAEGSH